MLKIIALEYFGEWKPSRIIQRYKNDKYFNAASVMPYSMALPIIVSADKGDSLVGWTLIITCLLVWFSRLLNSTKKEKMFYLCPLNKEEKIKNIKYSYFFGVFISMLILIIGLLVIAIFGKANLFSLIILFIMNVIYSSIILRSELDTYMQGFNIFFIIIYYFTIMAQMFILRYEGGVVWANCTCFGILILLIMPLYIKYCGKIRQTLDEQLSYEKSSIQKR